MQYTKTMIDLVFQIRKAAPDPVKSRIKLTSSDLPATLSDVYKLVDDQRLKMLIYEFLTHAGGPWVDGLTARKDGRPAKPEPPMLHEAVVDDEFEAAAALKPSREKVVIYRGQRIVVPA